MAESSSNRWKILWEKEKLLEIENTVGKGEIARNEQFLLSHIVFNKLLLKTGKNQGLFGKG